MNYLFDTNAILIYFREAKIREQLIREYRPLSPENTAVISVVTKAEIASLALRNKWGVKRVSALDAFLEGFVVADINAKDVINAYAEIETFSQGKLDARPLKMTARNMGKNDLWIAATSFVTNSILITSDKDFLHLRNEYIKILFLDIEEKTTVLE